MNTCTKILMSAVMTVSLGTAAFAQSSTGGAAGTSASGNQNQTGGSAPAAGGTGLTTPSDTSTGTSASGTGSSSSSASGSSSSDAMGSQTADTTHSMQGGAGGADAQLSAQLDKIASMPEKAGDALFVLDNAKGNMFEVAFAKLAQQKSQDDKVKQLAKMIEQDHTQANDQLKPIAQKMGLELPSSLPSEKQKMLSVFQAMDAKDFDTCFLLDNKALHAKDITSFTDHQKAVKDEDLRKYITAVLPKLQQHGMMIQTAASAAGFSAPMGGSASGGGSMGHGSMDHSGANQGAGHGDASNGGTSGRTTGGSGANTDPTAPANNQNPSNR